METIKAIFQFLEKAGIQDEFIVLSFVGAGVAQLLYKQNKLFLSYHTMMNASVSGLEQILSALKSNIDAFNTRCNSCENLRNIWHTDSEVWKETFNEKMDNLEDHMKEIKKQLLFK